MHWNKQPTTRLPPEWELYRWQAYANNWKLFQWQKCERERRAGWKVNKNIVQVKRTNLTSVLFPNEHLIWYHHKNNSVTRRTEKNERKKNTTNRKHTRNTFKYHEKKWVILYKKNRYYHAFDIEIVGAQGVHMSVYVGKCIIIIIMSVSIFFRCVNLIENSLCG